MASTGDIPASYDTVAEAIDHLVKGMDEGACAKIRPLDDPEAMRNMLGEIVQRVALLYPGRLLYFRRIADGRYCFQFEKPRREDGEDQDGAPARSRLLEEADRGPEAGRSADHG